MIGGVLDFFKRNKVKTIFLCENEKSKVFKMHDFFKKNINTTNLFLYKRDDKFICSNKKKIFLFAHCESNQQNNFDYFLNSTNESDVSNWFKCKNGTKVKFSLGLIHACNGNIIQNKGFEKVCKDWVGYKGEIRALVKHEETKTIWTEFYKKKLRLLNKSSSSNKLKKELLNLYKDTIKKVYQDEKFELERNIIRIMVESFEKNLISKYGNA